MGQNGPTPNSNKQETHQQKDAQKNNFFKKESIDQSPQGIEPQQKIKLKAQKNRERVGEDKAEGHQIIQVSLADLTVGKRTKSFGWVQSIIRNIDEVVHQVTK